MTAISTNLWTERRCTSLHNDMIQRLWWVTIDSSLQKTHSSLIGSHVIKRYIKLGSPRSKPPNVITLACTNQKISNIAKLDKVVCDCKQVIKDRNKLHTTGNFIKDRKSDFVSPLQRSVPSWIQTWQTSTTILGYGTTINLRWSGRGGGGTKVHRTKGHKNATNGREMSVGLLFISRVPLSP